jgi:hypothetical protein
MSKSLLLKKQSEQSFSNTMSRTILSFDEICFVLDKTLMTLSKLIFALTPISSQWLSA